MPVVAGEQLVPAVARQRHGDVPARHPTDQVGGDLGDIGERLVPDVRELGDDLDRLGVADIDGRVVRPEVRRRPQPPRRLVEGAVGETDGEGANRTRRHAAASGPRWCSNRSRRRGTLPPGRRRPSWRPPRPTARPRAGRHLPVRRRSVGVGVPVPPRRRRTSSSVVRGARPWSATRGNVTSGRVAVCEHRARWCPAQGCSWSGGYAATAPRSSSAAKPGSVHRAFSSEPNANSEPTQP